jgi:hypothetical protein
MKRSVLTFGLIAGAILAGMLLVTAPFIDRIGFDRGEVRGYTSMVLSFLLIFFGVRSYRDTIGGGSVSFGRAFAVGALMRWSRPPATSPPGRSYATAAWPTTSRRATRRTCSRRSASAARPRRRWLRSAPSWSASRELYRNRLFNVAITFLEPLPVRLADRAAVRARAATAQAGRAAGERAGRRLTRRARHVRGGRAAAE